MADLGPARRLSRAMLVDDVGGHYRYALAYLGTNTVRDHFTEATNTQLQDHTSDEGGGWAKVGTDSATVIAADDNLSLPADPASTLYRKPAAADGFLSVTVIWQGAGAVNPPVSLNFRMTSTTGTATNGSPSQGWAAQIVPTNAGTFVRLLLDGVQQDEFTVGVDPGLGDRWSLGVRFSGTTIEVWLARPSTTLADRIKRVITRTSASRKTETQVGIGHATVAGDLNVLLDDYFLSNVPSAVCFDADLISTSIPDAHVAAGSEIQLKLRGGRIGTPATLSPQEGRFQLQMDDATVVRDSGFAAILNADEVYSSHDNWFTTSDGLSGGAPRASRYIARVSQRRNAGVPATDWTTDSENTGVVLPAATTHDFGRGHGVPSTTATAAVVPARAADPDTFYKRTETIGFDIDHSPYRAALTPTLATLQTAIVRRSGLGSAWAAAGPDFRSTRTDLTDNVYPKGSAGVRLRMDAPASGTGVAPYAAASFGSDPALVLTAAPAGYVIVDRDGDLGTGKGDRVETSGDTAWTVDTSVRTTPHAEADISLDGTNASPTTGNRTSYVISADSLYLWCHARNALDEALDGADAVHPSLSIKAELLKPDGVIQFTATRSTIGTVATKEGFTDDSSTVGASQPRPSDFTSQVVAPAGNWTQRETIQTAGATGLEVGNTQVLGFASAYTAHRAVAVYVHEGASIRAQYRQVGADGNVTLLAFDEAPTVRVFQIDANGNEMDVLSGRVATQIAANVWAVPWSAPEPSKAAYVIEVRGRYAGGGVEAAFPFA